MVTSSVDQFKYQPDKIRIETVYHYIKSNMDEQEWTQFLQTEIGKLKPIEG